MKHPAGRPNADSLGNKQSESPVQAVVFGCHDFGIDIVRFLFSRGELAAVVVVDEDSRKRALEIVSGDKIEVAIWPDIANIQKLVSSNPQLVILSALFAHKIHMELIEATAIGVNLHPGYLPNNRGRGAVMWSLIDRSPAGLTAHVMTDSFDEGDILWRVRVDPLPHDTGDTLTSKVLDAGLREFYATWPDFLWRGRTQQDKFSGVYYSARDCEAVTITSNEFHTVDKIRAKTYRNKGLIFERDGKKYMIRADIRELDADGRL